MSTDLTLVTLIAGGEPEGAGDRRAGNVVRSLTRS